VSRYRHWIAGGIAYLVVFAGVFATTGSLVFALPLGLIFGIGVGLTTFAVFPADPELAQYKLDARRRVKAVFATTNDVADLAKKVKDPESRAALQRGCRVVHDLLELAQAKDPGNMASTAAKVGQYVTSVQQALVVHLQIEANPDYFSNSAQLLAGNRQGFQSFDAFVHRSVQQLNAGEEMSLRATLRTLEPMTVPDSITQGAR